MTENDDSYTAAALNVLLEDTPEFTDPRLAICLACLKRTIPASVFNKLLSGSFNILLIEVPGADWVNWVAAAAREVLPGYPLFIRTASRAGKKPSAEFERLVEVVTKQGGVIAIVESGDLPEEASKVADYQYKLRLPDRSALREVARRTLVGDHTRIKAGLDRFCELSLLGACFPPGGTVSATVARLQRLTGSSQNTAAEMPPLASLQGLDAAKEWGIDLKADLTVNRPGTLTPYWSGPFRPDAISLHL